MNDCDSNIKVGKPSVFKTIIKKSNNIVTISDKKNIISTLSLCVNKFANVFGIRIDSLTENCVNLYFYLTKKANIQSNALIMITIEAIVKKRVLIESSTINHSTTYLSQTKNANISSDVSVIFGNQSKLLDIDDFTLNSIDLNTLNSIGFIEGVKTLMLKKISAEQVMRSITDVSASVYRQNRLDNIDQMTLTEIDALTLTDIDRIIVT